MRAVVEGSRMAEPDRPVLRSFTLPDACIRPGLINGHDHLTFNHYPRIGEPPYPNVYAWAEDVHGRFAAEAARHREFPRSRALLFSALKNLLGGVTRVVHHDPWAPDLAALPLRVEPVRVVHSLRLEPDPEAARHGDPDLAGRPLCMHLAEGVDPLAEAEVEDAARRGLLGPDLLAVHLVAADAADGRRLQEAGVGFVWCPSSSIHLYGRSARPELFRCGLDLIIGTDALISGAGTLLDELRVARTLGHAGEDALEEAVGATPARRLGLPVPTLDPGAPADLVALRKPLLEAGPADVALVMVGGVPRFGDADLWDLFSHRGVEVEPLEVCGTAKLVSSPLASIAEEVFRQAPSCRRILDL